MTLKEAKDSGKKFQRPLFIDWHDSDNWHLECKGTDWQVLICEKHQVITNLGAEMNDLCTICIPIPQGKVVPISIGNPNLIPITERHIKTDEDRKEFFEFVKGKKIRWSNWVGVDYYIPTYSPNYSTSEMKGNCTKSHRTDYFIRNGFMKDSNGSYWILADEVTIKKSLAPKICDCGGEAANTTHSHWCSKM